MQLQSPVFLSTTLWCICAFIVSNPLLGHSERVMARNSLLIHFINQPTFDECLFTRAGQETARQRYIILLNENE